MSLLVAVNCFRSILVSLETKGDTSILFEVCCSRYLFFFCLVLKIRNVYFQKEKILTLKLYAILCLPGTFMIRISLFSLCLPTYNILKLNIHHGSFHFKYLFLSTYVQSQTYFLPYPSNNILLMSPKQSLLLFQNPYLSPLPIYCNTYVNYHDLTCEFLPDLLLMIQYV